MEEENKYLQVFLDVFSWHCEQEPVSAISLLGALKSDGRLQAVANYQGVYEAVRHKVSYAVSVDQRGCTTDVLVKPDEQKSVLFSFKEIHDALLSRNYVVAGQIKQIQEAGPQNNKVSLLKASYKRKSGTLVELSFPLDNQNTYYMTLIVQSFKEQ